MKVWRLAPLIFLTSAILAESGASDVTYVEAGAPAIQGDADCSGSVDPIDGLRILRQDAGLGDAPCPEAADTNCDGAADPIDALRILRFDAGLSLPVASGCVPIGEPLVTEPTSDELIGEALDDGLIDEDTALLYRTFAAFNDPSLPAQYAGPAGDEHLPEGLTLRPEGVDPLVEEQLDPFLLPPSAPGSWYANLAGAAGQRQGSGGTPPEGSWAGVPSPGGNVTVWWDEFRPEDEERADLLAAEVDSAWDKLEGLLNVTPPSDGNEEGGNDASYDIYLAPLQSGLHGEAVSYGGQRALEQPCSSKATFILVNNELAGDDLRNNIAHELMHGFQRALSYFESCAFVRWLLEGSATWSEDFVYPDLNGEHKRDGFFQNFANPMAEWDSRGYSSYIFFLYLSESVGNDVIRQVLQAAGNVSPEDAIDASTPGGFAGQFHQFALYGWNQGQWNMFEQWDGITHTPKAASENLLIPQGQSGLIRTLETPLSPLAVNYADLRVIDPNVEWITINWPFEPNGSGTDEDRTEMTALILSGGQWREEKVPKDGSLAFCRENDPISRIVLVMTNASRDDVAFPLEDNALVTAHEECGYIGDTYKMRQHLPGYVVEIIGSDLVFVPAESIGEGPHFTTISGVLTATVSGDPYGTGVCEVEGTTTQRVGIGDGYIDFVANSNAWSGYGFSDDLAIIGTISCPDAADVFENYFPEPWLDGGGNPASADVLQGERDTVSGGHFEWTFRRSSPAGGGPAD